MDAEILSRLQFALTAAFHFIFPPVTIGFSLFIVAVEALYLKTGDEKYKRAAAFFLKLFGMLFAVGVATGIVMVFQFGTNWPIYSRFVGDVFGSPLAIEAIFAFFMESTFLGVALWGWNRIGKKAHFVATLLVCVGTHLSSVWIITANSFMQTPVGFELQTQSVVGDTKIWEALPEGSVPTPEQIETTKAAITNFWDVIFSPSNFDRITHTIAASWLCGAFLALGVCGYYLLRKREDVDFAEPCAKVALVYAAVAGIFMGLTGHGSARTLATTQPEKLAAFEAQYETKTRAPLYLFGWVHEQERQVSGVEVGGWFSFLAYGDMNATVKGLNELPSDEFLKKIDPEADTAALAELRPQYWPPVGLTFQSFRFMVYLGGLMGVLIAAGLLLWVSKKLFDFENKFTRLFWIAALPSVLLPILASQLGWMSAEVGRQPWIVWYILKTQDAVTPSAGAAEILFTTVLFTLIFTLLSAVFLFVFFRKIKQGPGAEHPTGY